MGLEQGAEVGSGALIFSERPQETTEVMKQAIDRLVRLLV